MSESDNDNRTGNGADSETDAAIPATEAGADKTDKVDIAPTPGGDRRGHRDAPREGEARAARSPAAPAAEFENYKKRARKELDEASNARARAAPEGDAAGARQPRARARRAPSGRPRSRPLVDGVRLVDKQMHRRAGEVRRRSASTRWASPSIRPCTRRSSRWRATEHRRARWRRCSRAATSSASGCCAPAMVAVAKAPPRPTDERRRHGQRERAERRDHDRHAQGHRHRSRHHQLVRRLPRRRHSRSVDPNAEGSRTTPSVVALHRQRRAAGRADRQAAGDHQPENTVYAVKRLMGRKLEDRAVQPHLLGMPVRGRGGADNGDAHVQLRGRDILAARGLGDGAREDEARSPRTISARRSPRRWSRCPPTSTTRSARRPRTPAASPGSTCCASSTSRPRRRSPTASSKAKARAHRGLRSRRRHVRHLDPRARRAACSRCARPTATPTSAARTSIAASSTGSPSDFEREHSIDLRKDKHGAAAPQGGGRARQARAVVVADDRGQPAVHRGDATAGRCTSDARSRAASSRRSSRISSSARSSRASVALPDARLAAPSEIDQVILVGGQTRMPRVQAAVEEFFGKKPNKRRQPRRGGRGRRGAAGRACSKGAGPGGAAARRDAAVARRRDGGRRVHARSSRATPPSRRAQRRCSRRRSTTSRSSRCTCSRASARWPTDNKSLARFQLLGIPPAPRGVPQIEVDVRHRRQRHRRRCRAKDLGTGTRADGARWCRRAG